MNNKQDWELSFEEYSNKYREIFKMNMQMVDEETQKMGFPKNLLLPLKP